MNIIKNLFKFLGWVVLSFLIWISISFLVAYWMASGGWKIEDHKIFFFIWSGVPSIVSSVVMFIGFFPNRK